MKTSSRAAARTREMRRQRVCRDAPVCPDAGPQPNAAFVAVFRDGCGAHQRQPRRPLCVRGIGLALSARQQLYGLALAVDQRNLRGCGGRGARSQCAHGEENACRHKQSQQCTRRNSGRVEKQRPEYTARKREEAEKSAEESKGYESESPATMCTLSVPLPSYLQACDALAYDRHLVAHVRLWGAVVQEGEVALVNVERVSVPHAPPASVVDLRFLQ